MAPTEILAKQHFELTKKIFKNIKINIALITGKTEQKEKKQILQNLIVFMKKKILFLLM